MNIVLVNTNLSRDSYVLRRAYADALIDAGLTPVGVVSSFPEPELLFETACGLLLIGGPDYPAALYGMDDLPGMKLVEAERAEFDLGLTRAALGKGLPVLGVCGGCQIINIASGGTLTRDIRTEVKDHIRHWKKPDEPDFRHPVQVEPGSALRKWVGEDLIQVNSSHHQSVNQPGEG